MKKRVFSGIQPSGIVHIGNYIGALKNWVAMQETYDCVYSVVDLHALTVPQEPDAFRACIRRTAALLLALGIDPARTILFVQSDVPEHAELEWILNCFVYYGELSRMTQFKDKSRVRGLGTSAGLFTYPVLMAADILLYNTDAVPVGDDQRQHLELTRMTANRLNQQFPGLFKVPEPIIGKAGARVMGLDDPAGKMSKSAKSDYNFISLLDSPDDIRRKMRKAVTDSEARVSYDEEKKPAVSNLLNIYSAVTGRDIPSLVTAYEGKGYGDFKKDLAEALVTALAPIQSRFNDILADSAGLERLLEDGANKARLLATAKIVEVKKRVGLGR